MQRVSIVGGGLAGLALGIALRMENVPVTLHEAGRYPRHRVCGEFMAGRGAELLRRLGLDALAASGMRLTQTRWWRRGGGHYDAALPHPALGLSRHRIDAAMAQRFRELGGELREGSRVSGGAGEGQVWASGRQAQTQERWIGLKCHAAGFELSADLEMYLGRGAYAGASRIEDGQVNLAGLFPLRKGVTAAREKRFVAYLDAFGLSALARRVEAAQVDSDSCMGVSAFGFARKSDRARLEIGDCRCVIAPFTGNGMSLALEHAHAVAPLLARWSRGNDSWLGVLAGAESALRPFDRRLMRARCLQNVLLSAGGQALVHGAARSGLLPFRPLFNLLH